jgi:hypothetical protein
MKRSSHFSLFLIAFLLTLLMLPFFVKATTITLTQEQIDQVLADNPVEPPVEPPLEPPIEPPLEPPIEPPSECSDTTAPVTLRGWGQVFLGQFPMPTYQNVTYQTVPRFGYLSIAFDTGNIIDDGKLSLLENAATPGLRQTSISECKGDLNVAPECYKDYGLGGGLRWATNGKSGACPLQKNHRYYFNITFLDGIQSKCGGDPCYVNIQATNF